MSCKAKAIASRVAGRQAAICPMAARQSDEPALERHPAPPGALLPSAVVAASIQPDRSPIADLSAVHRGPVIDPTVVSDDGPVGHLGRRGADFGWPAALNVHGHLLWASVIRCFSTQYTPKGKTRNLLTIRNPVPASSPSSSFMLKAASGGWPQRKILSHNFTAEALTSWQVLS